MQMIQFFILVKILCMLLVGSYTVNQLFSHRDMAVCRCLWGSVLAEAEMSLWRTAQEPAKDLVQAELHWLLHWPHLQPECAPIGWRQTQSDTECRLLHCGSAGAKLWRWNVLVWCAEQKWHHHQAGWRLLSQLWVEENTEMLMYKTSGDVFYVSEQWLVCWSWRWGATIAKEWPTGKEHGGAS